MLHFYLDATTETGNLRTQSQELHPQEESNIGAQNTNPQEAADFERIFKGVRKEKGL
jgi:hypothetical protein